jgi:hypothetical protein
MPPKKTQLKGGLIDPSSVTLALMKPSTVQNLSSNTQSFYYSKNYLNVPNGGGKSTKKQTKSTPSATGGGNKTNKKPNK